MIPGMTELIFPSAGLSLYLLSSERNVDVFARVGSPSPAVTVDVVVESGVLIDSSDPALPSLDLRGFTYGSTVNLTLRGEVKGAGGAGAVGQVGARGDPLEWPFRCGGGGGGFGSDAGVGGSATAGATPGTAGSSIDPDFVGAGGLNEFGLPNEAFIGDNDGEAGGDCILATGYDSPLALGNLNVNLTVESGGKLYPGGGGGASGWWHSTFGDRPPEDGGASGQPGGQDDVGLGTEEGPLGGAAGAWMRHTIVGVTFNLVNNGDVRGSNAAVGE